MPTTAYPTVAHERAAVEITQLFAERVETEAVLLTNSCARGKATRRNRRRLPVSERWIEGAGAGRQKGHDGTRSCGIPRQVETSVFITRGRLATAFSEEGDDRRRGGHHANREGR